MSSQIIQEEGFRACKAPASPTPLGVSFLDLIFTEIHMVITSLKYQSPAWASCHLSAAPQGFPGPTGHQEDYLEMLWGWMESYFISEAPYIQDPLQGSGGDHMRRQVGGCQQVQQGDQAGVGGG